VPEQSHVGLAVTAHKIDQQTTVDFDHLAGFVFALPSLIRYTDGYHTLLLISAGFLQTIALYAIFRVKKAAPAANGSTPKWLQSIEGLLTVLAAGGFMWFFLPAIAIDTDGIWLAFRLLFFIVIFGGGIAWAVADERHAKNINFSEGLLLRAAPLGYLAISELLIYTSIQAKPELLPFGLIALLISYFPVRTLMIIRTPINWFEIITGLTAFAYFIWVLV